MFGKERFPGCPLSRVISRFDYRSAPSASADQRMLLPVCYEIPAITGAAPQQPESRSGSDALRASGPLQSEESAPPCQRKTSIRTSAITPDAV
jgi:hypothetical protein